MNILTKIRSINDLNTNELLQKTVNTSASWHYQYRNSAWIHLGGLSYDLSEGDIICVFSQFGEVGQIHYPRDKETGRPRGFCFLCYLDTRSAILAVDNLNGAVIAKRQIKVDHVLDFKPPQNSDDEEERRDKEDLSNKDLGPRDLRIRKERREKWRQKRLENPDYDHTRRNIRKQGVAPVFQPASESDSSDDGLLPYEGQKIDMKKIKKEQKKKRKEEKKMKKERAVREGYDREEIKRERGGTDMRPANRMIDHSLGHRRDQAKSSSSKRRSESYERDRYDHHG